MTLRWSLFLLCTLEVWRFPYGTATDSISWGHHRLRLGNIILICAYSAMCYLPQVNLVLLINISEELKFIL